MAMWVSDKMAICVEYFIQRELDAWNCAGNIIPGRNDTFVWAQPRILFYTQPPPTEKYISSFNRIEWHSIIACHSLCVGRDSCPAHALLCAVYVWRVSHRMVTELNVKNNGIKWCCGGSWPMTRPSVKLCLDTGVFHNLTDRPNKMAVASHSLDSTRQQQKLLDDNENNENNDNNDNKQQLHSYS